MKILKSLIPIVVSIVVLIIVFLGCYYMWFSFGGHSREEKEISIKFITSIDSSAVSLNRQQLSELTEILEQIKAQQSLRRDNRNQEESLTISSLNAFYGSLFTAFAVLAAILGLSVWRTRSNLEEKSKELERKIKELEEIGKQVEKLRKKKKLADWARDKFENNDKNDISSTQLYLSPDEKINMKTIKEFMIEEITDDSWLEIVLATDYVGDKKKKALNKAEKVFKFIENRDLLDEDSNIEAVLYHMLGLVYKKQSEYNNETNKMGKLQESKKYYEKALNCKENRDETLGNLAVVLIELYNNEEVKKAKNKLKEVKESEDNSEGIKKAEDKLKEVTKDKGKLIAAIERLKSVIILEKATYNTYYDLARAEFLNKEEFLRNEGDEKVRNYLYEAADLIDSIKDKRGFVDYIKKDDELKDMDDWKTIKKNIINRIDEKQYLK